MFLFLHTEGLDTATSFSKMIITLFDTLAEVEVLASPFPHIPNQHN